MRTVLLAALVFAQGESAQLPWPVPTSFTSTGSVATLAPAFSISAASANASGLLTAAAKRYTAIIHSAAPAPAPVPQCDWKSATVACPNGDSDCSSWVNTNCHPASTVSSYCRVSGFCHFSGSRRLAGSVIQTLAVTVSSVNETLDRGINESYTLAVTGQVATARAGTVYGALHAMETFAQIVQLGLLTDNLHVVDSPLWTHRGLMVDTARRFLPIPLLENLIDGLSYSKMNVLHLHLTDEPAVRFESKVYPELTAGLGQAFYTQDQLASLVAYAKSRGVRVVPELDVPAHSGGLQVLEKHGLKYCDAGKTVLANDDGTLKVVDALLQELARLFPDSILHFGADEACKHDDCPAGCTYDGVHAFEQHIQRTITGLGKVPMGWNDVFSDPKPTIPNAALPGTIVQNWGKAAISSIADLGFSAVDSTYEEMYLNEQCCRVVPPTGPHDKYRLCFWRDSGAGMTGSLQRLMEGGEVAAWSDNYCPAPLCAINGTYGWMYPPAQDESFSESFGNAVFPGAAAAAGSLWNYDASLTPKGMPSADFVDSVAAHVDRLRARGVKACRNGCNCDWGSSCLGNTSSFYPGNPHPSSADGATAYNVNVKLTNQGCRFIVHVKSRTPCSTLNGPDLGNITVGGPPLTVLGQDFILVGVKDKVVHVGDQLSVWVGDGTWMNVALDLLVTCTDTDTYINMAPR